MVRTRRRILGISQRELAQRSGLKQPLIAAIESGRRQPSPAARQALDLTLRVRPSQALAALRDEVQEVFARCGLPRPQVFGSVAKGQDTPSSDLDLLVEFGETHDVVDLLGLEAELSFLLTVNVEIVDARSARARSCACGSAAAVTQGGDGGGGSDRIERRLGDLAQFDSDARYTVSLGLDEFTADTPGGRVLRNNGRHILIQVATVVEKLPDSFKAEHPDVDWVAIGRMRNLIAHHYDKVDDLLVYRALAVRIPDLMERLGLV